MARVRNTGSSLSWYFSMIALTDSASIRAWAGSYTPHGRSQCAYAVTTEWNQRVASQQTRGLQALTTLADDGCLRRSCCLSVAYGRREIALRTKHVACWRSVRGRDETKTAALPPPCSTKSAAAAS